LGPLTNLARLEDEYPGVLKKLHTLWIPVHVAKQGEVKAWNLQWNRAATKQVFSKVPQIVLVDVDSAGTVTGEEL